MIDNHLFFGTGSCCQASPIQTPSLRFKHANQSTSASGKAVKGPTGIGLGSIETCEHLKAIVNNRYVLRKSWFWFSN
jgi:hypothetical protein